MSREIMQQALDALINGKQVRSGEGGTKYQPDLEDAAITALEAALAQPDETETLKRCLFQMQEAAKALAQPEQEPVAYIDIKTVEWFLKLDRGDKAYSIRALTKKPSNECNIPLYTAPPKRKWVGLTDDEIDAERWGRLESETFVKGVKWAEERLKEKNNAV